MATKVAQKLWASGDRRTAWTRLYVKVHPSGMTERITIEEVCVAHPRRQKIQALEFGPNVISRSTPLFNRKTGRPSTVRTRYWTVSQSGSGGAGTAQDKLGGFWTGGFSNHYRLAAIKAQERDLLENGFCLDAA
jgi:hypothetical protein